MIIGVTRLKHRWITPAVKWSEAARIDNRVTSLRFQKSFQLVLHERAKQFVPDLYRKNAREHIFTTEVEHDCCCVVI